VSLLKKHEKIVSGSQKIGIEITGSDNWNFAHLCLQRSMFKYCQLLPLRAQQGCFCHGYFWPGRAGPVEPPRSPPRRPSSTGPFRGGTSDAYAGPSFNSKRRGPGTAATRTATPLGCVFSSKGHVIFGMCCIAIVLASVVDLDPVDQEDFARLDIPNHSGFRKDPKNLFIFMTCTICL